MRETGIENKEVWLLCLVTLFIYKNVMYDFITVVPGLAV